MPVSVLLFFVCENSSANLQVCIPEDEGRASLDESDMLIREPIANFHVQNKTEVQLTVLEPVRSSVQVAQTETDRGSARYVGGEVPGTTVGGRGVG